MMGPDVFLSSRIAKYISRLSFIFFAMYSVFTGLPMCRQQVTEPAATWMLSNTTLTRYQLLCYVQCGHQLTCAKAAGKQQQQ
jgi:hypothetical protein